MTETADRPDTGPAEALVPLLLQMAEAQDVDTVWTHASGHFRGLGFARANYGYSRFLYGRSIGDPDDAIFLTTCSPDYVRAYFKGNFYARTPMFRWAESHSGGCTWAWVRRAAEEGRLTPDEMDTLRANAGLGIVAGITVSFPGVSTRSKGALGLIADPGMTADQVDAIWDARGTEIQLVAHMMHLKVIQMPFSARKRALTLRQREALEWVADSKNAQDVALLMGVSPAMVEKHLRLAREALSVDTTAQAVAKAALLNLIYQPLA